jgi:hypothetical protein
MDDRGAFIARGLECLGLQPGAVAHDNRSRSDLSHLLMSSEIRTFVRNFYSEDFTFFAADPALAHLAEGSNAGLLRGGAIETESATDDTAEPEAISIQLDIAADDLAAGRAQEASDRVKKVLAKHPDLPRALGMLGQIAVSAGHPAVGLALLQRAVALDSRPEHRVWLALCLEQLGCQEDAANVRRSRLFGNAG